MVWWRVGMMELIMGSPVLFPKVSALVTDPGFLTPTAPCPRILPATSPTIPFHCQVAKWCFPPCQPQFCPWELWREKDLLGLSNGAMTKSGKSFYYMFCFWSSKIRKQKYLFCAILFPIFLELHENIYPLKWMIWRGKVFPLSLANVKQFAFSKMWIYW